MKISEFIETGNLGDNDYVPISRRTGSEWASLKYRLSTLLGKIGYDNNTGRFNSSVFPENMLTTDSVLEQTQIPYTDSEFGGNLMSRTLLPILFEKALSSNQSVYKNASWGYSDVTDKTCTSVVGCGKYIRPNGYYPEINALNPYFAFGIWMNQEAVLTMLNDRYTPYTGGMLCQSFVNIPPKVKSTDVRLTLDYENCNNYFPMVIVLTNEGWRGRVDPASCYRAFHGCGSLRAIVAEISLQYIKRQSDIENMFTYCPELWQFHISNVPDVITQLNLSGCNVDICKPFVWTDTTDGIYSKFTSSFKYLVENCERNITRTIPLAVILSSEQIEMAEAILDSYVQNGNKSKITLVQL